jgi:hypothetical protein
MRCCGARDAFKPVGEMSLTVVRGMVQGGAGFCGFCGPLHGLWFFMVAAKAVARRYGDAVT